MHCTQKHGDLHIYKLNAREEAGKGEEGKEKTRSISLLRKTLNTEYRTQTHSNC